MASEREARAAHVAHDPRDDEDHAPYRSAAADSMFEEEDPEVFAKQIMSLMWPVFACMCFVVYFVRTFGNDEQGGGFSGVMYYKETSSDSTGAKFGGSVINMIILVAVVCAMT